jgi:F0F1-type ATP synthase assembly protein I
MSPTDSAPDNQNSGNQGSDQKKSFWLQVGRYSQLAFLLPSATVVGWLVGAALDRWLHTSWIQIVGLILGVAAGFIELLRTVSRDTK